MEMLLSTSSPARTLALVWTGPGQEGSGGSDWSELVLALRFLQAGIFGARLSLFPWLHLVP